MKDEREFRTPPKTPTKDPHSYGELGGGNSTTAKKDAKARFNNMFSTSTDGQGEIQNNFENSFGSSSIRKFANGGQNSARDGHPGSRFYQDYQIHAVRFVANFRYQGRLVAILFFF